MMHMTFYWGKKVTLLFDSWRTDSWTSYGLSLLAVLIVSVFYQYMEDRRIRFKALSVFNPSPPSIESPLLAGGVKRSSARFASALLFGVNSGIGYMLMLAVMSFNGGVFIAIVLGLTIGYLFFRIGDDGELAVVDSPCACA